MSIRKIIGRIVDICLWVYACINIILLFFIGTGACFLAIFMPEQVIKHGWAPSLYLFGGIFSYLMGVIFVILYTALAMDLSTKQFLGFIVHKALDWRIICNPLTDRWYPELYKKS